MNRHEYPLIYWQLPGGDYIGQIVGTEMCLFDLNPTKLKAAFSAQLKKASFRAAVAEPEIRNAELKTVVVTVRPAYRKGGRVFPLPVQVDLPVPVVHGPSTRGGHLCFLPTLDLSFACHSSSQVELLTRHFARDALRDTTPSEIVQLLLPSEPGLDIVSIPDRSATVRFSGFWKDETRSVLSRLADRFPPPRSSKKVQTVPEVTWERGDEVRLLADLIFNRRSNVLVVGESGVGKSAVLREAALETRRRSKGKEQRPLAFWRTTPGRMIAGARYLGEWQRSCETLVEELSDAGGVLWVVDFMRLFTTGGHGSEDSMAAFLVSDLRQGRLQMIGEVTPTELDAARKLLPGFLEYFKIIPVAEMDRATSLRVMEHLADYSERNFSVAVESEAVQDGFRLLERFVKYEKFPGKAISFMAGCVSQAIATRSSLVDSPMVISAMSAKTGLAEVFLRDDLVLEGDELERWFRDRIIGQEEAVGVMSRVAKVFKAGLNHPGRPVSTLVFAGPTGVGKTASARALAQYFFGKGQRKDPLIRLDMSEFQHPYQIARLIGSSGSQEPGSLVRQMRERPFCVLLLDEIEKAHPAMFDVLLNVLDEGVLSDAYGRVTDFRNSIIILTTNLGSTNRSSIGFAGERADYLRAIARHFRPEFYNRLDEIVSFAPLGREAILSITRKELREASERPGFVRRGIEVRFTEYLVGFLAEEGFDPKYGARPLQRTIERRVVGPVARFMLNNPGIQNTTLTVTFDGEAVRISR